MAVLHKDAHCDNTFYMNCPGCKHTHVFNTNESRRPAWSFNGDFEKPTFTPSMIVRHRFINGAPTAICHFFVRDGQIEFLADSTHELAGKTVPMVDGETW